MPTKKKPSNRKPKLTPAERHKRFVDMAQEVGASESPESFDVAFKKVTKIKIPLAAVTKFQKTK